MIKFKDFNTWTYNHAAEGRWNYNVAIFCIRICVMIKSLPVWKRRRLWIKINKLCDIKALMQGVDSKVVIRRFVMK